jgi:diaminopimelate decarboxylase
MVLSEYALQPAASLPRLPAKVTPFVQAVLSHDRPLLHELSYGFNGPFHLLFPAQFEANVKAFRTALSERRVDGRVLYAKKTNKAACWIERCAALGIGVDVASLGELREALGHGVTGSNIGVTGPAKSDDLLRLAILQGCLTAIDSLDELERFTELARAYGSSRVLLRCLPPCQPHSRFGLDDRELTRALEHCRNAIPHVILEGFSFHLSGYAVQPRADLTARLLHHCRKAQSFGLPASCINIGGGVRCKLRLRRRLDSVLRDRVPNPLPCRPKLC